MDGLMADDKELQEAREVFEDCLDAESENRTNALEDLKFARLGEQWDQKVLEQRKKENRPALTINKQPAFIRQVVNDARQNKPQIKVKPVDGGSDPETAEIMTGLIRNIEYISGADVAYDTAAEFAVSAGFGYFRIDIDYAYDDTFDLDILIKRIANPFSVFGDPYSTAADSSDWNVGFVTEFLTEDQFSRLYPKAEKVNWDDLGSLGEHWADVESKTIRVAEYWKREEITKKILRLSTGEVIEAELFEKVDPETRLSPKDIAEATGVTVAAERDVKSFKVTQRCMNGSEILKKSPWPGKYIPIVPVYGEEVNIEGKRYFRSLIRDAKDAQRMFNYWRTTTTELVALAPKAPFIGPKGSFKTDPNWDTANTETHSYLEYDPIAGQPPPQRQPFSGVPAGALQEALNASDDMKAILGMYDASLGARSNETSGKAIMARQREGDVSTYHFVDNLTRAIRHAGRILIDLIPHVYTGERVVRVLGHDGKPETVPLGQPVPRTDENGQPLANEDGTPATRIFDLTAGKYDLAVDAGPSFTTRREEVAMLLTEMMRSWPQAVPILGDLLVKYLDLPDADEIQKRLANLQTGGVDPQEVAKLKEGFGKLQQEHAKLQLENQTIKADRTLDAEKLKIEGYKAETERMQAVHEITRPPEVPQPVQ
jgi:hypothetical protein